MDILRSIDSTNFTPLTVFLSVVVLASAGTVFFPQLPVQIPSALWLILTLGVPTLLAIVALLAAVGDGFCIHTFVEQLLSIGTLVLVGWTIATVLFSSSGGVNFGPLFVLMAASVLAITLLSGLFVEALKTRSPTA